MKKPEVSEYTVYTDKIPQTSEGFKFIMMSDLHSNDYKVDLHMVNEIIKDEKPDAVLLAGDMINGTFKDDVSDVANYLTALAKHYQVFYGIGNHEYKMKLMDGLNDMYYEFREWMSEAGITFLEDETVFLEKENAVIALSGVEIDSVFYERNSPVMGSGLMDKHLGGANESMFNILLAHNPEYFYNYANWGADLVLSGHLHGGIIRLPKLGGLISTSFKLFPHYDEGMYEMEGRHMIVSRGLGTHTIKIRINNRPELVVVKVLAKKSI